MNRPTWTPRRAVGVIAYAVLGMSIVVLFISDARQDAYDRERPAEIAAAQAKTIQCMTKALRADAEQTKELRKAIQLKDDDLVLAMQALIPIVQFRVIDGGTTNEEVSEAARQFITQARNFINESETVEMARAANPVPNTICGVKIE